MDAIGGHHVKQSKSGSETKATCFLSYMEDRAKEKHIRKNNHDHIQTHM
jgi:hypothetical protein